MTPYIQREIRSLTARALKVMPVVVITGMRQTGKTTFLQRDPLFRNFRYVTLDDFATLQTALSQPEALVASGGPLIIDEAQRAPGLLRAIKRVVDKNRSAGRFVLSGSANFSLLKGISESLAGRAVYFTLQPFSRREIQGSMKQQPLLARILTNRRSPSLPDGSTIDPSEILRGGMPAVAGLSAEDAGHWFRGFEQTYVERDVRDIARVEDMLGFRNLIGLAALRTGGILNMSQIARDARVSVVTATRYLQLAETSFLFKRLPPFLRNRSSRLIKSPKLYMTDSGLACHLAGVRALGIGDEEQMRGVLFETYLLQNISSILETHVPDARISYWHVQGRHEVDFVIELGRQCVAIEVKAAGRWTDSDLGSLRVFAEKVSSCRAAILAYNGTQTAKLGPKLWAAPMGALVA